jgi:transcriptional regulator with XRE-family HTH domain
MNSEIQNQGLLARLDTVVRELGGRKAVAERFDIGLSTLNNWLTGVSEPRASVAGILAKEAGYTVDWLIFGEGQMRPDSPAPPPPASAPVSIYEEFGPAANEEGEESVLPRSIINFCGMVAGFAFELSKAQGWLRDIKPDEFAHLTEGIIEMESRTCLPDPSYRPSVAAYKKMLKLMNR